MVPTCAEASFEAGWATTVGHTWGCDKVIDDGARYSKTHGLKGAEGGAIGLPDWNVDLYMAMADTSAARRVARREGL